MKSTPGPVSVFAASLAAAVLAEAAVAQSSISVRAFGSTSFDSALNDAQDVVDADCGPAFSVLLHADNTVSMFGRVDSTLAPPPPPPGLAYLQIAAGNGHLLTLRSDGNIVATGSNGFGEINVPPLPPGVTYVEIAAGGPQSVARRSDGVVVAFGMYLGDVPTLPAGATWLQIAAGKFHSAAVRSDGQIGMWGGNVAGESSVTPLPPGLSYVEVACGGRHTLARRSDGSVVGWGNNGRGQINVPPLPPGTTYVEIDCGDFTSIARRSDGAIVAWGDSQFGQSTIPALPAGRGYTQAVAGDVHMLARRSDNTFVAWGNNDSCQCNVPRLPAGVHFVAAYAPTTTTTGGALALRSDGEIAVWGSVPPAPPLPTGVRYVQARGVATALRSDGIALSWAGVTTILAPSPPPGVSYVDVGRGLALRSDGVAVSLSSTVIAPLPPAGRRFVQVDSMGAMFVGLLDDGSMFARNTVVLPPTGTRFLEVRAALNSAARQSDGTIFISGSAPAVPAPAPGTTWVGLATGLLHVALRRSDGAVFSIGGPPVPPPPPGSSYLSVDVAALTTITVVLVGPETTYAQFAVGCAGTLPAARLVPVDTPRLGAPLRVHLFDLPLGAAVMLTGFSNTTSAFGSLPLAAAPFGMPGCALATSIDELALVAGSGTTAEYVQSIPTSAGLVGLRFYQQAAVLDPTANGFGAVLSAASAGVIGT